MRLLYNHDAEVAHWVCERIPHLRERIPFFEKGLVLGPGKAIGVLDDANELVAGTIFHNFDPFVRSMEVSCAADTPRWANREVFSILLRYPFVTADCQRLTASTPRRATSTRRFLEGLGFKREGSCERAFGDDNAIVYGLLVERWREGRFCRPEDGGLSRGKEVRPRIPASA